MKRKAKCRMRVELKKAEMDWLKKAARLVGLTPSRFMAAVVTVGVAQRMMSKTA